MTRAGVLATTLRKAINSRLFVEPSDYPGLRTRSACLTAPD